MRFFLNLTFMALIVFSVSLCFAAVSPPEEISALINEYKAEAARLNSEGKLHRALEKLKVVTSLTPADVEAMEFQAFITSEMQRLSRVNFNEAQAAIKNGQIKKARKLLLISLSYGNKDAIKVLKDELPRRGFYITHRTKKGETTSMAAMKVYGKSSFSPVLDYLLPPEGGNAYSGSRELELPKFSMRQRRRPPKKKEDAPGEAFVSATPIEEKEGVALARALIKSGEYIVAREIARESLEYANEKKAAHKILSSLDKRSKSERKKGIYAFKKGDIKKALVHWELSITMNPEARGLDADIMHTRHLLNASEAFEQEDYISAYYAAREAEAHTLTKQPALELIRKIRMLADKIYRLGLKHYIAERMDQAIAEWERALKVYPGHERSVRDIKDARKLKKKIQSVR
jgi:hypothetical protein